MGCQAGVFISFIFFFILSITVICVADNQPASFIKSLIVIVDEFETFRI